MKRQDPSPPVAGIYRLLVVFILLVMHGSSLAHPNTYDPDQLFQGVQFSFDFRMVSHFGIKYQHDEGYQHLVSAKGSHGYEMGFLGSYYINKKWSLEIGILAGSRRNLNYDVYFTEPEFFRALTDDPDLLDRFYKTGLKDFEWSRDRLTANWSMPVSGTYHHYLLKNPRHRFNYQMGIALRYFRPLKYTSYGTIVFNGPDEYFFEEFTILWNFDRKLSVDLQPGISYTFVLKNQKAISTGLMANLSFSRILTDNTLNILNGTPYEESGHFTISNHYLALYFRYVFTTPDKKDKKRNKRN